MDYETCVEELTSYYGEAYPVEGDNLTADDVAADAKELVNEITRLQTIVDKLPRYVDTGEAFVPDRDHAWINLPGASERACAAWDSSYPKGENPLRNKPPIDVFGGLYANPHKYYSTNKAAEAAKKDKDNA